MLNQCLPSLSILSHYKEELVSSLPCTIARENIIFMFKWSISLASFCICSFNVRNGSILSEVNGTMAVWVWSQVTSILFSVIVWSFSTLYIIMQHNKCLVLHILIVGSVSNPQSQALKGNTSFGHFHCAIQPTYVLLFSDRRAQGNEALNLYTSGRYLKLDGMDLPSLFQL